MFYPYCTIGDNIEVTHTPLDSTGHTLVHIEIPDAKYCFRTNGLSYSILSSK